MTLYVAESLGSASLKMGDLRDQLKKIKLALGLRGAEKKSVAPEKRIERKTIEVTLKKNLNESLPPPVSKPESGAKKTHAIRRSHQAFQNKAQATGAKIQTSPRSSKANDQSYASNSGVTITRTIAPGAVLNPAPAPIVKAAKSSAPLSSTVQAGQLALPSFTALTRTSEFKTPDTWVSRGTSSQMTPQASGLRREIYIGLDFGTAYTKAAVQFLDNIYPVDWNGVANLQGQYLLPTEYSEAPNLECFLGQHPDSSPQHLHANLKRAFITNSVSENSIAKASVFLALVLQYVRAWIYHHHAAKLGFAPIGWYLNIGIPSDVLDKDKHAHHYTRLAEIAWVLSLIPQAEVTFDRASELLSKPINRNADLREIAPIPELVAQLAGYSKSASKQRGLHALVDIGGGTVDMVTFNVHEANGDDVFPFFVANVKALGSYALLAYRFQELSTQGSDFGSDVQNILTAENFSRFSGATLRSVQEVDKKFFRNFQIEFESMLRTTHKRRYPSSPHWVTGIRTFISGGGALIPGYPEAIETSNRPQKCPLFTMDLPPHPKVVNIEQHRANYSRISVACGLTFDSDSLGTIRPASEVDDATPLISTVNGLPVRERPDRDELYPK
jgi:hypothetical protein